MVSAQSKRNKLVTEELLRKSLRARHGKPLQAKRLIKAYLVSKNNNNKEKKIKRINKNKKRKKKRGRERYIEEKNATNL